jgi:uncharacterized protein
MDHSEPFIHLFSTIENFYVYDVNTNRIIKAEEYVYRYLENLLAGKPAGLNLSAEETEKASERVKTLQQHGYLSAKRGKTIMHHLDKYLEGKLASCMENLILQVTQACNLRCKYCAYTGEYLNRPHGTLSMPEEIAKKAIDFYISRSSDSPRLSFGFYGGEPFLNFGLIKVLLPYIKKKMQGKPHDFHITTNGTIMNEEIIKFLALHDVALMVSLDGPKEVHDLNRCYGSGRGSYDDVMKNIDFACEIAPDYVNKKISFNSVLTKQVSFCSFTKFFTDFKTIKAPFVTASSPNRFYLKENAKVDVKNLVYDDDVNYETFKYFLSKMGRLPVSEVSKLIGNWEEQDRVRMEEKRIEGMSLPDNFHPSGPCVPGVKRLFVNIRGELFPCERVNESSEVCRIGDLNTGIDIDKARKLLNIGRLTENECKNCWAVRFCSSCVASADNGETFDKKLKLSYCKDFIENAESMLVKYCSYREFNIPTQKQQDFFIISKPVMSETQ